MLLSVTRKSLVFVWFLSLFLLGSFTYAQSTVNYNYSTATNASLTDMSTGATSLLAAGVDDTPSSVTNIGFNFVLMGVPYSQFSLTENGIMRLGSTAMVSNTYAIPNSTIPTLAPFGNDMRVGTDGSVVYKVLGTAPSRVLVVQWKKIMIRYLGTAAAGTATFEARLYESTGVIEYVYGEMATNTASPASYYIGFSVNTTANNLISVNTTDHSVSRSAATANTYTASSTVAPLHSTSDGSRRIYTFTPPTAPSAPSNLTFTSVGAGSMTLNWTDNSSNELGFSIARSTDGVNYSVVGSVGANVATYNATNLTPNTTYYWAVQAYSEGAMSSVLTASQTTNPPGNFVSAASGNWNVAATWTNNMVPSASDNVTIADGHTVVIDAASTCLNLTVGQGTSGILRFGTTATNFTVNGNLTVSANGTFDAGATGGASLSHTLYIGGSSATANTSSNVVINGTFKMYIGSSNGKAAVTFFGANNSTVSGTGTTMDFYQVILNKGATTATSSVTPPILELQRAFTVQGSASTTALATTFTAGVLKISGTFNQSNAIFSSTSYSIPALGGIWLNNPNFTITGLGGSPTNNGLVRVSNGKYIIGTSTGQSMSGGSSSVFIIDSGTVNVAGRLTMASSGTYYSQTGGTVVVQMSGNAASSNPGFSMSSSSGTTFAMSGGSIVLQLASTGSTQQDYNVAPATVNITGGTLQLGNASSGTAKTFKIMGNTPNLIVDSSSAGHTANLAGNLIVNGDILVKTGATLTNGLIYSLTVKGLSSSYPGNILNRGTMTFNQSSSQYLIFNSSFGDQTVTNNGTITANQMGNVDINNTATNGKVYFPNGVSIANTGSSAANLKLTAGTLVATSLTLGGGSSSTAMFTCTRTAGTLQNAPSFAFGSGSVNYIYNGSAAQVTGNELPASISNNLTINNANGVTLNSPFSTAILTLTNGILTTTATNLLTVTGAYVGGVARTSGYVNGPMVRTLPGAMATGSTYLFPVGKSAYTPVELVNPTTSGISSNTVQVLAEVFDASSQGTAGTGLSALNTNRYWNTAFVGASTYFTNATLRVTETAAIDPQAGLGQNTTGSANGVYNLIGSTISGSTIASSTVTTLGYLNIGTKSVPMAYSSSTTTQPSTQPVPQQSTSQAVIQVQVVTTGNASPLNVSKFTVNANGTTSASDITNARIYYTGTSSTFATTTQFGSTVASPTIANYTISGSQNLVEGTNYFWLTYDIPTAAVIGDSVDAECSLITINGTDYTPTVTAPAGKRAVKNVLTVGTGVLTQAYPMHRNYNYSTWEGIYLQSEVGTAKVISKIGFTKSSGTDVTGIQSVQVYLKHTSGSTLAAGQYSLSGYTQVFNGSFTNNAASGLMEVSLDKSFYYNGTDNLQVLIVKGNQAYISTYPYYYATSVATTRVRQAGSDSYQPGTGGSAPDLATTTYLPNLTLTYSIPTPMTFVSAANTQALSGTEVSLGSANQQIIGVKVVTSGQMSPLTASAFSFNTGSSSDPATDLVNAKLFYTGNSSTFATTQQIGDAFVSPNADFAISSGSGLPVTLQSDTNYFWLTYDISSGATRGDIVDALCNAVTISSADQPVAPHAGAGRTIVAPLAGTYNVGSGSKYTTIASAINALKTFGVSGAVTFLLKDATYPSETFPITIDSISGANSTNTVTFKPSTGVSTVISGSSATAIIKINGADYVTIDGSNTAKGTDRSLTITNTNSAGAAVMLASNGTTRGATYNTIKNCVISTGSHIASGTYGIFLGGSTIGVAGDDNDNNTISNNVIKNARYGIYSYASSTGNNDNITVSDNIIGDADTAQTFGTYGIYVTYLNSSTITRNTIFGASNAIGYIYGIYATGSLTNTTISKNKIYGLKYVGTGGYSGAGMYISSVASSNVSLINNVIYGLGGDGYSGMTSGGTYAIGLMGGTGFNIYNNSVYLSGTNTYSAATLSSVLYLASGVTGIDMRNNIFVNTLYNPNSTGDKNYIVYSAATSSTSPFTTTNYNQYYAPATGVYSGVIGLVNSVAYADSASWKTFTAQEANSYFSNPNFISTTDLRLNFGSYALQHGTTLAAVTDDILGTTRNNPPSMGAYENGLDATGPSIAYTALGNTLSTSNITLSGVTITDLSGVNTTAGTKPRIYFKRAGDANTYNDNTSLTTGWKYAESASSSSPFDFTIDYSLLYNGGVATDTVVQYFVVSQDNATPANVSANTATFAATPSSVALTSAAFPVTGTINSYRIQTALSGKFVIGPGQTYTTLTAAVNTLNNSLVTAPVTFELASNYVSTGETFPIVINQNSGSSSVNTVTIKPATGANLSISGSSSTSILKLNGADYVIIDGSNLRKKSSNKADNEGSDRNLTFENTNTSTTTAVVWLASASASDAATNNIIKNCIIKGSGSAYTLAGVFSGGTASVASSSVALSQNNGNTIQNNQFLKAQFGIMVVGGSSTLLDKNIKVISNKVGTTTASENLGLIGISLQYQDSSTVAYNEVQNVTNTSTSSNMSGVIFTDCKNGSIYGNNIHSLRYTGTSTAKMYGLALYTTVFNAVSAPSNHYVYNNSISDLTSTAASTSWNTSGITVNGGYGDKFYFNSVSLTGQMSGTSGTGGSACFSNGNGLTTISSDAIDLRNNVFYMNGSSTAAAVLYAHYTTKTSYSTSTITNNLLKSAASGSATAKTVYYNATSYAALSDFQTATGFDANSISGDPIFTSVTDLRPGLGSPVISAGTAISGITTDLAGTTRNNPPSMGAYESAIDAAGPVQTYTALTNTTSTGNVTLSNVTITDGSGVNVTAGTNPRIYFKRSTDQNTFIDNTNSTDGWKYTETSGSSSPFSFTIDYSLFNGSAPTVNTVIQYFVVAQDMASTPNVGAGAVTFNATPASVGLTSTAFPVAGTINSYTILNGMGGTITIGPGQVNQTLTAAANLYSTSVITSPVVFELAANYTSASETFPIVIPSNSTATAVNNLTIRPAAGAAVTIAGASTTGIIKLNGADYVTIDGSNNGSSSRDLTITNTTTSGSNTACIWVGSASAADPATYNVIKNCNLSGYSSTVTQYGIFMGSGVSSPSASAVALAKNNLNTFQNNAIRKVSYGIYLLGASTSILDSGTVIYNNKVGGSQDTSLIDVAGIYLKYQTGLVADMNEVQNVRSSTSSSDMNAVYISEIKNSIIRNNQIHHVAYSGTSTTKVNGIYQTSSAFITVGTPSANTYYNNIVYDLASTNTSSYYSVLGIGTNGGYGDKYYYNSVSITGTVGGASGGRSMAFSNGNALTTATATAMTIVNNSFYIVATTPSGTYLYAHYTDGTSYSTNTLSNNLLYAGLASANGTAYVGYLSAYKSDLASWQTATGGEVSSVVADPLYASSTSLHPQSGSPLYHAGALVAGITTDIDGAVRNGATPSIGAYEEVGDFAPPVITYTVLTGTTSTSNRTLSNVSITDAGSGINGSAGTKPRIYYKKKNDANAFGGNTSSDNGWKWTEAAEATTPFSFTIDYSLLRSTVVVNDTIQYFVTAQDLSSAHINVGALPSTGFSATSVSVIASAPTTPYYYKIVGSPLAGDYTVGVSAFNRVTGKNLTVGMVTRKVTKYVIAKDAAPVDEKAGRLPKAAAANLVDNDLPVSNNKMGRTDIAGSAIELPRTVKVETEESVPAFMENGKEYTGPVVYRDKGSVEGTYLTLTAALTDYNERGISANTRFLLTDTLYSTSETFPLVISSSGIIPTASSRFTIQPASGITTSITASSTANTLVIYDPYVTIEGSSKKGTDRSLTIQNAYSTASGYIVSLMNNGAGKMAHDVTIKNIKVKGSGSLTVANYGIFLNASGGDFDNVQLINNQIYKVRTGIQFAGVTGASSGSGLISNNVIGDTTDPVTYIGILASYTDSLTIKNNEIYGATSGNSNFYQSGILLGTSALNTVVLNNKIHDFYYTSTSGYGCQGIYFSTGDNTTPTLIANNEIWAIRGDGDEPASGALEYLPMGILVKTGGNVKIYNNTIKLTGSTLGTGTYVGCSGDVGIAAAATSVDLRNNILVNSMTTSTGSGTNSAYNVISLATATAFANTNYNNYYSNGINPKVGYLTSTNYTTLADWRTATSNDANSVSKAVNFVSAKDYHLSGSSIGDKALTGQYLSAVATDIDGDNRSKSFPYMGVDENKEYLLGAKVDLTALLEGFYNPDLNIMISDTVHVSLHSQYSNDSCIVNSSVSTILDTLGHTIANLNNGDLRGDSLYYLVVNHRNHIETWSAVPLSIVDGMIAYDFTSGISQAYGNNMIDYSGKSCIYTGDVDFSGSVDFYDMLAIDNDSYNYATGYIPTDVNGDGGADFNDMLIVDNNSYNYVAKVTPIMLKKVSKVHQKSNVKTSTVKIAN